VTNLSRRNLLKLGVVAAGSQVLPQSLAAVPEPPAPTIAGLPFLRPRDTGPGGIQSIKPEDLPKARLTPETWQVEIIGEGVAIEKPRKFDDGTAFDYASLLELGKKHGVKYLKAMQCRGYDCPQGHAIWEGVPLREVIRQLGKVGNVMRVTFAGYHDKENKKMSFHAVSASYTQVMESPPGDPPIILAYRLNGAPIPLRRGGPVRVIVPFGYGFKNVKWLQRLTLTAETKPFNTYGGDPDSYLKTMAWAEGPGTFEAGAPITLRGAAVCGVSGLKRVEYWLRPDTGETKLKEDDPAWQSATWQPCVIEPPPANWKSLLPAGISSKELWGFEPETGKPKDWPLRYSLAFWTATLQNLKPGSYELRVRSVDPSGFAQPEPRPQQATGRNAIQCKIINVS
jgi:DMSO/TMAO reductase YedYZ molybdopterin-dependent catalytic subunit